MPEDDQRRLERFGRLQPPPFSGIEREDAQEFLDRWWETYEKRRSVGAAPLTWQQFSVLFLEKFVPESCRDELHRQFEQLHQGEMSVTQYEMRFSELARHAIEMVRGQERTEREAKRPRGQGDFSGSPQGGQFQQDQFQQSQSSFSALPAQGSHYAPPAQVSSGNSFGHQEQQFRQRRGCFECGDFGHIARYCSRLLGGTPQQSIRPTALAPVPPPLSQLAKGGVQSARGGA
ncbi:uncharacterized protein [Nicotiana tomentosiformis]|uniref:uncharacterized protein n=1 Tax=Nicotiana tomentosiformis TaxID=4098 RepID=UPI00388C3C1A